MSLKTMVSCHAFLNDLLRAFVRSPDLEAHVLTLSGHPNMKFSEILGIQPDPHLPAALRREIPDLGADSLDTVELIMEFEKEFNISIPDDQAENISTVGQAISYLEQNVKK